MNQALSQIMGQIMGLPVRHGPGFQAGDQNVTAVHDGRS